MKKTVFFFLFFISALAQGQEQITIGNKYKINSRMLGEDRPYWVYLPPTYSNPNYGKASYPVIYLLDGDANFTTMVAIQDRFSRGMYVNMPECIIVGIPNTDRTRDLTPSKSELIRDGKPMFNNSGGAENFTVFLTKELRTCIDSSFRTNGYNLLVGHSFGGLFAINTLIHHPEAFQAYVALDPSLWWDNRKLFSEAAEGWRTKKFDKKFLFVAMAKDEDRPDDRQKHSATIHQFCTELLPSFPENGLMTSWKMYESEDHGTVILPGIYDAMRSIFEGIQVPVKQVPKQPGLIEEHYRKLSEKLGCRFVPSEMIVDNIGKYALSIENTDGAKAILEYNLNNYPDSKNARSSLAKLLRQEKNR
jgi:predicted alpha/beta superfamily hydrolase